MEVSLAFRRRTAREFEAALRLYQKAREILERLVDRNPSVISFRSDLAGCYSGLGLMLTEVRRPSEALPWLRKAHDIIQRLIVEQPFVEGFKRLLASNCVHFGRMPADVIPTSEALDALRRGEHILVALPKPTPDDRYNLAFTRALISPLIGRGQSALTPAQQAERSGCEALAMKTLREAIAEGYHDFENMNTDGDLDALRARKDFQGLLRGLKTRGEAAN